jgi:hypothetical protein
MIKHVAVVSAVMVSFLLTSLYAQTKPTPSVIPNSDFTVDYPSDHPGSLVRSASWEEINSERPAKTKTKGGIAASLSYGALPAKIVAEYEGLHAATQVVDGRVVICICRLISIPGDPAIVKLHVKKNARELDGGKMIVYPVVGGSKMADANKSDLLAVDVAHPDPHVWLVRSQTVLEPGEYALMLGTQNVNIFPFTVKAPQNETAESSAGKKQ